VEYENKKAISLDLSSATLPAVKDMVAALGVPSHGLWRNVLTRFKFMVAESISKETPHIFIPKRWNRFFANYLVRLALYVCLKNICDGVGCQNGLNGTPLDPPLFWLDNIFKSWFGSLKVPSHQIRSA
jgi:hypothetical protein